MGVLFGKFEERGFFFFRSRLIKIGIGELKKVGFTDVDYI